MRRDAGRDPHGSHPGAISQASRAIGNHTAMLSMLKGLPLAYNKDMQEDKAALFDALDTAEAALNIATGVLATLTPNTERMRGALNSFMLATDLSEYLVRKGVPFRETHHISGRAVQMAEERGCALTDLTLADLKTLHPLFTEDVRRATPHPHLAYRTKPRRTERCPASQPPPAQPSPAQSLQVAVRPIPDPHSDV